MSTYGYSNCAPNSSTQPDRQKYPLPQAPSYRQYTPQYAVPTPRLQHSRKDEPLTLTWQKSARHMRVLVREGTGVPLYNITRDSRPFHSGPEFIINSTVPNAVVGTVTRHTWTSRLDHTLTHFGGQTVTWRDSFTSQSGLGQLNWSLGQGSGQKQASMVLVDGTRKTLCTIELTDKLQQGRIQVWGLNGAMLDEVIVSAIAFLEGYRKKIEDDSLTGYGIIGAVAGAGVGV